MLTFNSFLSLYTALEIELNSDYLTLYFTKSLPCAEALGGAAAERNKRFFPKITARLVFKISSFFSFLSMVIFHHASIGNVKKYMSLCYSENEIFHIFTYITVAVRQTAEDRVQLFFIIFYTKLRTF